MTFDVFISYPHQDKPTADAVCAALESAGIRCWIAPRDVPPGAEWAAAIVDAIDDCRLMVLIFSSNTNNSKQIHREVQRAFDSGKSVVPLRIDNVMPQKSLAYYMGMVHWLDALTPPLEAHLKKLTTSVAGLLATVAGESTAPAESKVSQTVRAGATTAQADSGSSQRNIISSAPSIGLSDDIVDETLRDLLGKDQRAVVARLGWPDARITTNSGSESITWWWYYKQGIDVVRSGEFVRNIFFFREGVDKHTTGYERNVFEGVRPGTTRREMDGRVSPPNSAFDDWGLYFDFLPYDFKVKFDRPSSDLDAVADYIILSLKT